MENFRASRASSRGSRLAALLCFALVLAPVCRAEDYRFSGPGNKYRDDGFDGFGGFADDIERAGGTARERAGDRQKEGEGQMGRARDLNNMGDQIGKDRNNLLPRVAQARQQDQKNSTGSSSPSSRVQKLMQQPYNPQGKYREAIHALGLRSNGELYHKGPAVQEKLYTKAEELAKSAEASFQQAAQGAQAARKMAQFQQTALARNAGMRNLSHVQAAKNDLGRYGGNNRLALAGGTAGGSQEGSGSTQKIGSGLSGKSDKGTENGSGISVSAAGGLKGGPAGSREILSPFDKKIGMKPAGAPGTDTKGGPPPGAEGAGRARMEKSFAALDALFDQVAGKDSSKAVVASVAGATSAASAVLSVPEGSSATEAVIAEEPPAKEGPAAELLVAAKPVAVMETSEVLGNGFLLEEESLFERVRQSYARAERSGRILRP